MAERVFLFSCLVPVCYYRAIQSGHPEKIRAYSSCQAARGFLAGLPERVEFDIQDPEVVGYSAITQKTCRCYRMTIWEIIE